VTHPVVQAARLYWLQASRLHHALTTKHQFTTGKVMFVTLRRIAVLTILWFVACAVPPAAAQDKKAGAGLLKDVKVPKGYEVTLFAAPPEVNYPTCLACAPTGEVFVGIDQNGSLDAKPGRGKILRLVDSQGTGKADKITLFAKVDSPRGLIYDNKKLYVLHPPYLSAYYDDDGDGVADRSEVLVKGIGKDLKFRGADHTTNGIRLGIDGWIYIAVGDYGFTKAVGKDGKELQFRGGGIVRVRPDGTELEVVTRGLRNIYDVAIDPLMNVFTRDNTNDGDGWDVRLNHDTPLGQFGYPSLFVHFKDEILPPLADYGGGAPTGALFMDEPGFPPEVGRTLLTCDWGRSIVYRHPLKANGASFTIEQATFVSIQRPTGIAVDGQGRLYIASWRGGSYTYSGPDVGFLVRVTHPGLKVEPFPDLARSSDEDLLKHLTFASQTWRLHVQQEILRRGAKKNLIEGLEKLAKSKEALPVRVAAIFTRTQLGGAADFLVGLVKDDQVREFALRALADRKERAATLPAELFERNVADANPRVRLQAVLGLARIGNPKAASALIARMGDSDPVVAHTAINALVVLHAADACLAELGRAGTPHTLACVRVLQSFHEKAVVDGLLERFAKTTDDKQRHAIFRGLCRLVYREADWDGSWWGTRPNTNGPYYKPVQWQESARIGEFLKNAVSGADGGALRYMLPELVRHRIDLPDLTSRLIAAAKADPDFQATAADLLVTRGKVAREAVPLLEAVAQSVKADPGLRAKVLRALWRGAPGEDGLQAALRCLAGLGDPKKAPSALADLYREFTTDFGHAKKLAVFVKAANTADAGQRELAYLVLLNLRGNKNATRQLIESVDKVVDAALSNPERAVGMLKAIGVTRSEEYGVRVQGLVKSDRPEIRQAATDAVKLLGLDRPPAERKDVLKGLKYDDIVTRATQDKGDAVLGGRLFLKQNCIACHTVSKNEPVKGPYLGDVTARYKRPELIESILRPSAKIAQGFETHIFTMTDGKIITGFVVRESGDEIELRDVAGLASVLKKANIDERRQSKESVMPEGLVDTLTVHELASILAYLESLNPK
jgi:putative heme-binding domain-containing protein